MVDIQQETVSELPRKRLRWVDVCSMSELQPGTAVAALLDGDQVALIRPAANDQVFALCNFDPFSKAYVISRGIIGDKQGAPKIASPIYKQSFDLATGRCLDEPDIVLQTYAVRVIAGRVYVAESGESSARS